MNKKTVDTLFASGHLLEGQHAALSDIYLKKRFSLYYELRTILYLGVLLFTSGIALLVYQNIDTLGHQVIIALLVSMMAGCFWYVKKNQLPYTHAESQNLGALYDYVLLLGALLWHYQPRDLVWADGIAY